MGGATQEPSTKEEMPENKFYPEMDQEEPPTGRSQTKYVPSIMSETPIGRSQTKYEPSIMSETPIEYEPSIKSGTPITHGEKDNIELLGEVYHLVQGGALTQDFSILTQTRTPVLGNTMLHIAARYGRNEIVDRVANQAPKLLFMRNKNNDTALHVAARAGHIPTVKKLLEAYNNFQRPEIVKEWAEFMHWNQSHGFNEENYVSGLIDLMKLKNEQGNNVLHEAMMSKEANNIFQVFEPYVAENRQRESLSGSCYKAALNITNKANQSVLYLAVEAGHKETVILILDKCPHNVKPKGISPLVPAIMNRDQARNLNRYKIARKFISRGSMAYEYVKSLTNDIIGNIYVYMTDMLTAILDKKQEWIHVKDTHGRLPLHYAASTSYHEGVVHLLNKCKSCSNQKDKHGFFPLHLASHGGNVEVVKELLKYCPDPTEMLDECGRNILHIAAKGGKYEVVLYILLTPQLEGMINQKDKDGNTPLHLASKWCHPKIVYALTWDDRVNVSLINHRTETALDIVNGVLQSQKEKPSLRQAKRDKL
ncbi:Protein ACCELERATED CELL DEATH 6, partial [Mucuna pruriens]